MTTGVILIATLLSSGILAAPTQAKQPTRFTFTEYHMGVDTRLVVYAKNQKTAEEACAAAFERIAALDTTMSDYMKDSELTHLSNGAGGPAVKVSKDLFKVLKRSQDVSRLSDGLFDVTVGPLVQTWRKARKTAILPAPDAVERARALVGWGKLTLNERAMTVRLTSPGMRLDLGAIGKGFADDEAQIVLKRHGIASALVEMGGDIVVSGPPPGTDGWLIRVPNAGPGGGPLDMRLKNCAISTSGDSEQFVVIGGVKYSHVVDPHTGYALTQGVEATVIAKDGLTADPVSTALTLLDEPSRARLLKAFPGTRCFVRKERG